MTFYCKSRKTKFSNDDSSIIHTKKVVMKFSLESHSKDQMLTQLEAE